MPKASKDKSKGKKASKQPARKKTKVAPSGSTFLRTRSRSEADRDEPAISIAPPADTVFPALRMRPVPADFAAPHDALAFARSKIREVPDFPIKGVTFKDITPLLASPRAFHIVLDALAERFIGEHVDAVVGIEARGFIFGGALAARLNASFVPARKIGKLPWESDRVVYDTEYSSSELEMHKDSLAEEARVIVVDDVLATGGTARAAGELVHRQNAYVLAYAFVVELGFLKGRERLLPRRVESVVTY